LGQGETHSPTMLKEAAELTPQEDGEDNMSWLPYVLFGAGGLCVWLLAGLVAYFFVCRRKGPKIEDFVNKEGCTLGDTEAMDPVGPAGKGPKADLPDTLGDASASRGLVGPGGYGKLPIVEGGLTSI